MKKVTAKPLYFASVWDEDNNVWQIQDNSGRTIAFVYSKKILDKILKLLNRDKVLKKLNELA